MYHVIAICHVKVSETPPTCVGGSLPLAVALGPPVTWSGTAD